MCAPAAIAGVSLGLQVVGAVAKHKAQSKASKANAAAAREARLAETRDLSIRQIEERVATQTQIDAVRRQAEAASGDVNASAAEAGVRGTSVSALLADIRGQEGTAVNQLKYQNLVTLEQLERVRGGAAPREASRVAQVPPPSLLATGLQIAGASVNALTLRKQLELGR